jgi:hypothetical protein
MKLFAPPANIHDFKDSSPLAEKWNDFMYQSFDTEITDLKKELKGDIPAFFNPKNPPQGDLLYQQVTWLGFPNTMVIARGKVDALRESENPSRIKIYIKNGDSYEESSLGVRQFQDEYLEWSVNIDQGTGKIKEIIFTCEGPEYWNIISHDKRLLLKLYRKYASEEVQESDLFHTSDLYEQEIVGGITAYSRIVKKGDYNIWNKWNLSHAIHLHQHNNSLGAEINIAASATILRKKDGQLITDALQLICCAGYGGPNRNSDPTIGEVVNSHVNSKRWVSLREPIGVYISEIDSSGFRKPDGSFISDFRERYWSIVRGDKEGKMILRAILRVPEGELFENRQLLLGDLLLDGEPLRFAGQVANIITMGLWATVVDNLSNRPKPLRCPFKCCQYRNIPDLNYILDIDKDCGKGREMIMSIRMLEEHPVKIVPSKTRT